MSTIPTKEEMYKAFEERHGKELQNKLLHTTVAVCGLGGLGSNISVALTRLGVGKLIIIDFDKVDISNLHRQQYKASQVGMEKAVALKENLKEISTYIDVEPIVAKIDATNMDDLLSKADIVCEAFDNPQNKAMLVNYVLENMPDKYLVAASGMAGMDSVNMIKTRKIGKRFYLCGDGVNEVGKTDGLFSTRVMACAAHEAHMVLRIISENFDV